MPHSWSAYDGDLSRLAAACESASRGRGAPAVRLVETARALAAYRDDDECGAAQLPGYTCDLRPLGELDPLRFAGDATPRGFCVSPTCE